MQRRGQFKPDAVSDVIENVIRSSFSFGLTARLEVHLDHLRMSVGNGKMDEKTKGRSLVILSAIEIIIVEKENFACLVDALIILKAGVNGDPKYKLCTNGKYLQQPVSRTEPKVRLDIVIYATDLF